MKEDYLSLGLRQTVVLKLIFTILFRYSNRAPPILQLATKTPYGDGFKILNAGGGQDLVAQATAGRFFFQTMCICFTS